MFWADEIAEKLKQRKLDLEWVDDMKTPSGKIHVGALRGVIVHDLVYKALKSIGVNTKYTYVFEDHDPMDDIPSYLPKEKYEKYLGMPLFKVPAPVEGFENYAKYYALEFKKVFNEIGCDPEIIWTKDLYTSGKMNDVIKECLDKAPEIRKIYEEMYKKEIPSSWYPFQPYCPKCGKVSTTVVTDWDGKEVTYECQIDRVKWTKGCGAKGKISPFSTKDNMVGKLPWKVEWPAKWKAIGITVEGAGKDHMSSGGSHDLAKQICQRIINYPVSYPIAYEWLLVGGRKMSTSKGVGTSATEMLEILPPELIRFLMVRIKVNQQINFDPFGETIPALFDEYQKAAESYFRGNKDDLARIFELSQIDKIQKPPEIRFSTLAQWVQMPNMDEQIKKDGLGEWAKYAKIWVEKYAPEKDRFLVQKETPREVQGLSKDQKAFIATFISKDFDFTDGDKLQIQLYQLTKELGIPSKEAFAAIYIALIGKTSGPKAAWLIQHLGKEFIDKRFAEAGGQKSFIDKNETVDLQTLGRKDIFSIDKDLAKLHPSISVGIAIIKGVKINKVNNELEKEKEELLKSLEDLSTEKLGQYPEVLSYRKLYKEMGIDWHSRRPSPEALLRRVSLKKGLYAINTCVDAYNLIVMKHRVSIGAFDLDEIKFPTTLRLAEDGEEILLLGDKERSKYKKGEIAYFDKLGGYNIDFNYRDAQRTAVQLETKNLYINVDGVFDITPNQVEKTLKEACNKIIEYCGGKIELFGVETSS
jgi:lysyl-tRNA synthetase, class I